MSNDPFPPSLFGRKTLRVSASNWVILLVIGFLLGSALIYFHQAYPGLRESIKFGAELLGAGLTILGLLATAENLRRSVSERQTSAASRFIERYNDPTYHELKLGWKEILRGIKNLDEKAIIEFIQAALPPENQQIRRHITVEFLNFFEELAIAVHTRAADEELLRRFFRSTVLTSYSSVKCWVEWTRNQGSHRGFIELEILVDNWTKEKAS